MRTDGNSESPQPFIVARPQRLDPPRHKTNLMRQFSRDKAARTDKQDIRLCGIQADPSHELAARRAWPPLEPLVEQLCTGRDDARSRHRVQLDRLTALDLVPDEYPLGDELE